MICALESGLSNLIIVIISNFNMWVQTLARIGLVLCTMIYDINVNMSDSR